MKKTLLTDVMAVVAEELTELAQIAESLDKTIEALVPNPGNSEQIRSIQRVDMLHQHLRDLTAVVAWIAQDDSNGYEACMDDITRVVKLDYIRKRLMADDGTRPMSEIASGRVDFF